MHSVCTHVHVCGCMHVHISPHKRLLISRYMYVCVDKVIYLYTYLSISIDLSIYSRAATVLCRRGTHPTATLTGRMITILDAHAYQWPPDSESITTI